MFLDCGNLVAGDVFGDVAAVLAVLEVVVGLAVGAGADDGEVAALHAGDGGHFCDACGEWGGLHTGVIYAFAYTMATKKTANPRNSQPLKKFVVHPARKTARLRACPPARFVLASGMSSTFGHLFRIHTYGESHGGGVGVVIDGCPPRIPVTAAPTPLLPVSEPLSSPLGRA